MTPSCKAVRDYLSSFRGARAYHPMYQDENARFLGNNGDLLMRVACTSLLQQHQITEVDSPRSADLIVLDGGALREEYKFKPAFLADICSRNGYLPIALMPSTFLYRRGSLATLLSGHPGPITLFCREVYSFSQLKHDTTLPDNVSVELDHDIAFEIIHTQMYAVLEGRPATHVLIVERRDLENPSGIGKRYSRLRRLAAFLPTSTVNWLYPVFERALGSRRTEYRLLCEDILQRRARSALLPRLAVDVSNPRYCCFADFCDHVSRAGVVFTTRLHVGILSSLLGIPTYLAEGLYHKVRGVYEYSMTEMNHVTLMGGDATSAGE